MLKILVQVDPPKTISFILDGMPKRKSVINLGWKWIKGAGCRGCYVTNDKQLAETTAKKINVNFESNGTAESLGINLKEIFLRFRDEELG